MLYSIKGLFQRYEKGRWTDIVGKEGYNKEKKSGIMAGLSHTEKYELKKIILFFVAGKTAVLKRGHVSFGTVLVLSVWSP